MVKFRLLRCKSPSAACIMHMRGLYSTAQAALVSLEEGERGRRAYKRMCDLVLGLTLMTCMQQLLQGLVPDKALSRELNQARKTDLRTPGATPLVTPGMTPCGSPRGSAPSTPFRK